MEQLLHRLPLDCLALVLNGLCLRDQVRATSTCRTLLACRDVITTITHDNSDADLARLPFVPRNLKKLSCVNAAIRPPDDLPNSLSHLTFCKDWDYFQYEVGGYARWRRLPRLPPFLVHLDVSRQLWSWGDCVWGRDGSRDAEPLPLLPDTLEYLDCSNTTVSDLPPRLPPRLKYLICGGTKIAEIHTPLPEGLIHLDVGLRLPRVSTEPHLLCISVHLPRTLLHLDLEDALITELPDLPPRLRYMNCSGCDMLRHCVFSPNALPPPDLEHLDCSYMPSNMRVLDGRNAPNLRRLDCIDSRSLEFLEGLTSLHLLDCSDNPRLIAIPCAPELRSLECYSCPGLLHVPSEVLASGCLVELTASPSTLHLFRTCESLRTLRIVCDDRTWAGSEEPFVVHDLPPRLRNLELSEYLHTKLSLRDIRLPTTLERLTLDIDVIVGVTIEDEVHEENAPNLDIVLDLPPPPSSLPLEPCSLSELCIVISRSLLCWVRTVRLPRAWTSVPKRFRIREDYDDRTDRTSSLFEYF